MDGSWNGRRPDMPQRLNRLAGLVGERGRSTRVVGLTGGAVALILTVAITVSAVSSGGGEQQPASGAAGESSETAVLPSQAPSTAAPSSPGPSPSKSKEKKTEAPPADDGQGGEEDEAEPAPTEKKPKGTVSTGPTSFDAWRTGAGKYAANWEWPVSDGGLRISGYILKKCDGTVLLDLNDATYAIEFNYPFLDCVTVQAVNAAGEGEKSTTWVPNNP
ncbi:hypothetical protein AB0I28_16570 [Phytomonospora sp. NPDC050363]|uniref:hypothetical protein n=1 Tax=Phytomonospora sp. NPDC050363 TaxID=3155642 RepID=UPI0033C0BBE2